MLKLTVAWLWHTVAHHGTPCVAHDMGVVVTQSFLPVEWMVQAQAPMAFVGTGDVRMNAKIFQILQ